MKKRIISYLIITVICTEVVLLIYECTKHPDTIIPKVLMALGLVFIFVLMLIVLYLYLFNE